MTIVQGKMIRVLLRLAIGMTLLIAGLSKQRDSGGLFYTLLSHNLLGAQVALLTAALFPWVEITVGLSLVCGVHVRGAVVASMLIGILFVATSTRVLVLGLGVDCGCFGGDLDPVSMTTLLRATIFVSASGWLMLISRGRSRNEPVRREINVMPVGREFVSCLRPSGGLTSLDDK